MIKLSSKWNYAIKSVVYLWKKWAVLIKISQISIDLGISESLLRRIVADLEKNNIIKTLKGRNWWIRLWKQVNEISIYDILFAVWEELWISNCSKGLICSNHESCYTSDVYNHIQKWLIGILKLYTIDKII